MAEIFGGGGLENAFRELGIDAKMTYKGSREPYYEVWELNKKDLRVLEEVLEWPDEWGFFRFSKGSNMGSAAEFLNINGQFMIGWGTLDNKDTYDSLMDYFHNGLNIYAESDIISISVDLARVNGKTVGKLFEIFEG